MKTRYLKVSLILLVIAGAMSLASSTQAGSITLESTGFTFTLPEGEGRRFPTVTGENEIGVFSVPIPPDLFPAPGDPGGWIATEVSITFTVGDGDTGPGDADEDDLVLTLGTPMTLNLITLPLALNGFPNNAVATVTNTLDLSTDPDTGKALATFLSESEGLLTFFITDLDEGGNFLDFRNIAPDTFELSITLASPPRGRFTLTARVFIDFRCDGFFKLGLDRPLANVPVTLTFSNGSSITKDTGRMGLVYFHGFDAAEGVTVSAVLPESYRGYSLEFCPNCYQIFELDSGDFGAFHNKYVAFRAKVLH